MLTTVIRNLLTNAVKFTPKGGAVTLTISPTSPASTLDDRKGTPLQSTVSPKLSICVADTGIGMTPEQIKNLSRRETAGKSNKGLGLIVCKEFLEKHGSELKVESTIGKGSRFWFTV
jgi:signal transduction histidine kinase